MESEMENETEVAVAETESRQQTNEELSGELKERDATVAKQKLEMAGKDAEIAALKQAVEGTKKQLEETGKLLATTVSAYREMVVGANPAVLAEMVTGDSIEKINESLESARALAAKVRQGIEAEMARTRAPAGAPQRTLPDMAALSAREKIQMGIDAR